MATYVNPTDPPSSATLPPRHPGAPAPGEEIASHYPRCFGCGLEHLTGLHMQVFATEGLGISAEFEVTDHHQGAPGIAHGGLLAAAFDEALGRSTGSCALRRSLPGLRRTFVNPFRSDRSFTSTGESQALTAERCTPVRRVDSAVAMVRWC